MSHHPGAARRLGMAALLVLAAALTAPVHATAGTYEVSQCRLPDGSAVGAPDMSGTTNSAWAYWDASCSGASASMGVSLEPSVSHAGGTSTSLTFAAPPDTSITGVAGNRVSQVGAGAAFGTPTARIDASVGTLEWCASPTGCAGNGSGTGVSPANAFAYSGFDSSFIRFSAGCEGGGTCPAENPKASLTVYRAQFTLKDTSSPLPGAVTGPLVAPGVKTGTLSASYPATDTGGGLYRTLVNVDGTTVATAVVDPNGGACADAVPGGNPYEFTRAAPCDRDTTATSTLDTSIIADGDHDLSLVVEDAAGNRATALTPTTRTFDNDPPSPGTVTLTGTPRSGQTLTAAATGFDGQSPALGVEWLRCDTTGSDCQTVQGASGTNYTLGAADVGKTLRPRVSATDGGGTTSVTGPPSAQVQEAAPGAGAASVEPHTPVIGAVARAESTGFAGNGVGLTYQWQRCSPAGVQCTAVDDVSGDRYPVTGADAGRTLRVVVTAANDGGSTQATSPPTGVIAALDGFAPAPPGNGPGPSGPGPAPADAGGSAPGGSGGASAAGPQANGTGATKSARLSFSTKDSTRRTVRFGKRITIAGRLVTPSGKPISGARLDVLARVKRRGDAARRVATIRTDARGAFTYTTAKGPSRSFDIGYAATLPAATAAAASTSVSYDARQRVELDVTAGVRLAVAPRAARNLQTLTYRGRLLGAPVPKRGKVVLLQAQVTRRGKVSWQTFMSVRSTKRGDFVGRYRLTRTFRPTVYRFRAVAPRSEDYPYGTGASKVAKVRVR